MACICESPLAISLMNMVPTRLKNHSYSIMELAKEMSEEFQCPVCEILTPMGEALLELAEMHQVEFDSSQKRVMLA